MKQETYEWMKMMGGTMIGNQNFITFRNNDFCTELQPTIGVTHLLFLHKLMYQLSILIYSLIKFAALSKTGISEKFQFQIFYLLFCGILSNELEMQK